MPSQLHRIVQQSADVDGVGGDAIQDQVSRLSPSPRDMQCANFGMNLLASPRRRRLGREKDIHHRLTNELLVLLALSIPERASCLFEHRPDVLDGRERKSKSASQDVLRRPDLLDKPSINASKLSASISIPSPRSIAANDSLASLRSRSSFSSSSPSRCSSRRRPARTTSLALRYPPPFTRCRMKRACSPERLTF